MKTFIFALLLLACEAFALCVPTDMVEKLGCQLTSRKQSCLADYGAGMSSVIEADACTAKNATENVKRKVPSNILSKVKSSSDEIDAIITMIDRKGIKQTILNFRIVEVKSFNEDHIRSLLEKMKNLREELYQFTISVNELNSKLGKQAIIYSARYYSFVQRIHQIMASAAHQNDNLNHNLSYDKLSQFTLKLDKRIGLEILARMNLKASHLDSETLKIVISEEEKQNYEFNVLQSPYTMGGYAKLVQFMSIREFLNNRWALQRMTTQVLDNPKVAYCGPKMLSFVPGHDGTMGTSDIADELATFDLYFTQVPKLTEKLEAASMKASLISNDSAAALTGKVFANLSSFKKRMIEEFGWSEDELLGWQNDIASTLKQNEDNEWANYAKVTLTVAVFPGDRLSPAYMEERIITDIFNLRKEAIQTQMNAMMNDLSPDEKVKMQKVVSTAIEEKRQSWEAAMRPLIRPIVSDINNINSHRVQNYTDKISQTREIVRGALSAVHFQEYIVRNKLSKTLDNKVKVKIPDLDPKSPSELIELFQAKLVKHTGVNYYMDKDSEKRQLITNFFGAVNKEYEKISTGNSVRDIQKKLYQIAAAEAKKLFAKYPEPAPEPKKDPFEMYQRPVIVADNTRVAKPIINPYVKVTVPSEQETNQKPTQAPVSSDKSRFVTNPTVSSSDSLRTSYNVMSMARLQPVVADNTRVVMNRQLPTFKEDNLPKEKSYNVHIDELNRLTNMHYFLSAVMDLINIKRLNVNDSFIATMGDQNILADSRLAAAYNASALLKVPLTRVHTEMRGLNSRTPHEVTVSEDKPALIRMLSAYRLNTDGTQVIDGTKLDALTKETIAKAIANSTNKTATVCLADYRNPGDDKNYKDLFRSSTFIRQGILSDEALSKEVAARLNKLDEKLKKETRYFHEAINEDWLEPMMNVAMVIFIVSALIIPVLGSAGILAPGSMMLMMTLLDGVDLAITGASLYFRSVSTFYEIPAQVKFQKSIAFTQVENFSLTSWDDVKSAEASSKMAKTMLIAFAPLEAIVGGQFYFSAKKLIGISGKQALRRAGMPARGFGAPPKTLAPTLSLKEMIKKKGVVMGTVKKISHEVGDLKYWLPRYQPLTQSDLTGSLRKTLVGKAKVIALDASSSASKTLADEPWKLLSDIQISGKRIDDRLNVNHIVDDLTGAQLTQASMNGKLTWKEFINKPSYANQWLIPKSLYNAIKHGRTLDYFAKWGTELEAMTRLRGRLLSKRKKLINTVMDKLGEVQKMALKDPEYLAANGRSNWMDHFQSLLSDEELKAFRDIVKTGSGKLNDLKGAFKDYDTILESIVPFNTVRGSSLVRIGRVYGLKAAEKEVSEDKDLFLHYIDSLENDGSVHIADEDVLEFRRIVEEAFGVD